GYSNPRNNSAPSQSASGYHPNAHVCSFSPRVIMSRREMRPGRIPPPVSGMLRTNRRFGPVTPAGPFSLPLSAEANRHLGLLLLEDCQAQMVPTEPPTALRVVNTSKILVSLGEIKVGDHVAKQSKAADRRCQVRQP